MRRAACLAILLVFSGAVLAAPMEDGARWDSYGDEVQRSRQEAREAYGKRRQARRELIEESARFPSAGPGAAVPGWRDVRSTPDEGASPEAAVLPAARRYGLLMTLLVVGAILLIMILRIHLRGLLSRLPLRRLRAAPPAGPAAHVPQTILLRSRAERTRLPPAADSAQRVNP
jgi:hypothetical protein